MGDAEWQVDPPSTTNRKSAVRKRSAQACTNCKRQKLKCSGAVPCSRCTDNNLACEFEGPAVTVRADVLEQQEARISRIEQALSGMQSFIDAQTSKPIGSTTGFSTPQDPTGNGHQGGGASTVKTQYYSDSSIYSHRRRDDPVTAGIIKPEEAQALLSNIIPHLRTHGPLPKLPTFQKLFHDHKFFLTICCATAAQQCTSKPDDGRPALSETTYLRLMSLAEAHLADSLSNASHDLFDVLGLLIASCWELRRGVCGKQRWLLVGHTRQVAVLLGLDRTAGKIARKYMSNPSYLPHYEELWGWWLMMAIYCHDCLITMSYALPPSTTHRSDDVLHGDFFHKLTQKLFKHELNYLDGAAFQLATETAAAYELSRIARLYVDLIEKLKAQEDELVANIKPWNVICQHLLDIIFGMDRWYKKWLSEDSMDAANIGDGRVQLRHTYLYYVLCVAGQVLKVPKEARNLDFGQQHILVVQQCFERIRPAATAVVDEAHLQLTRDGAHLAPDCYATAVAHAASAILSLSKTSLSDIVTISPTAPVIGIDDAIAVANKAIKFLEDSDSSALKLQAELAQIVRNSAISLHIDLAPLPDATPLAKSDVLAAAPTIDGLIDSVLRDGVNIDGWDSTLFQHMGMNLDDFIAGFPDE